MAADAEPQDGVPTKVFVGNLSFKIVQEELEEAFAECGNVVSANIITRGPRSLGYGFVEFATREDAEKAVELMNQKDIDGRAINVEVAKPRAPRNNGGEGGDGGDGGEADADGEGGRRRRRGRRSGRGRRRTGPRSVEPENGERAPSASTLFVANLPFSIGQQELTDLFTEKGHPPALARVVLRRDDRSKGYGFVEFNDQDTQVAAQQALDGHEIDGRAIIVKIAYAVAEEDDTDGDAASSSGDAAPAADADNTDASEPAADADNSNADADAADEDADAE
jgi:RNA recognition motif-containing protein